MISANSLLIRMLENIKRRIGILAITGLTFFLAYPIRLLVSLSKYSGQQDLYDLSEGDLAWQQLQSANTILGYGTFSLLLVTVLAGLIALTGFSYLHKRNKVDFYHSMPVSATKRFFTIFINCVLIFVVCGLVNLLFSYVICATFDVFSMELLAMSMKAFLTAVLYAAGIMAITALATILTGKGLISFFAAVILAGYEIVLYVLVNIRVERFFESLVLSLDGSDITPKTSLVWAYIRCISHKLNALEQVFAELSPYEAARLKEAAVGVADPAVDGMTGDLVLMAVMTVITVALAWICYVKRPGEAAGKTMSFERMKRPVKIAVMIPVTMLLCDLITALNGADSRSLIAGGNLSLTISMLLGSVLGCMIFEVIYEMDLKAVKKHLLDIIIVFAVVLGIQCFLQYDVLGIDTYQPKAEEVESIGVADTRFHTAYNYYDEELYNGYYSQELYYVKCCQASLNEDPEFKAEALRLVEAGNEYLRERKSEHAVDVWSDEEREIYVLFKLKNGEEKARIYRLPKSELETMDNLLLRGEETRSVLLQAFCGSNQQQVIEEGRASLLDRSQYESMVADTPEAMTKLREAYLKDMEEFTVQTGEEGVLVGTLQIGRAAGPEDVAVDTIGEGSADMRLVDIESAWEYPVYDTFTHTLAYLSSTGNHPGDYLNGKELRRVTISFEEEETVEIPIEATETIETLIKSAGSDYIQDPYKSYQDWDYNLGVLRVEWTSTEHPDSTDYFTFRADCSPEIEKLLSELR